MKTLALASGTQAKDRLALAAKFRDEPKILVSLVIFRSWEINMQRSATLVRVKDTGEFIIHPFGTFKGYGGYVGIYPYRLLESHCSNLELGEAIVDALHQSKATGYAMADIDRYREEFGDAISTEIRTRYFSGITSGAMAAKRFEHIDITSTDKSASITVCSLQADAKCNLQKPTKRIRVAKERGAEGIGDVVRKLLDEKITPKRGRRGI